MAENIALLGVLIPSRAALKVFRYIIQDLGMQPVDKEDGRAKVPFDNKEHKTIEAMLVQGFADIRVIYKQEVEEYLLNILDELEFSSQVARQEVRFRPPCSIAGPSSS